MYSEGELFVYGQSGVCRLQQICASPFDKQDTRPYYVLKPLSVVDRSTIFVPAEMAEGRLRCLMDRAAAEAFLARLEEVSPILVASEKVRKEAYRQIMKEAKPEGYVAILKTVARRRLEAMAAKRQLAGSDSEYEQRAKEFLCLELSWALGIEFAAAAALLTAKLQAEEPVLYAEL